MCTCFPLNLLFSSNDAAQSCQQRFIRPFTISPAQVKLAPDSRLNRDQTLTRTVRQKCNITTEHIPFNKLKTYVQTELTADQVHQTTIDSNNIETTKIIQNLYITSFGALNLKKIKGFKINLFLNATIDLPIIDFPKLNAETLRVPITVQEPETLNLYLNDVADKIHENYLKNGNTLIYCLDGTLNSIVLALGYLLKYTDLMLSEALLHLRYSRASFDNTNGYLGRFKEPMESFARRLNKNDVINENSDSNKDKDSSSKKTKKRKSGV